MTDHHVSIGATPTDPILLESTRRRKQFQHEDRRRKTVAHFGPRSLPVGGMGSSDIPRAPIATPLERGGGNGDGKPSVPDKKFSVPPIHFSPPDRHEGSRSCEDQNFNLFDARHHPHRHSIGFLRPPPHRGDVTSDVSFNVDSSVDDEAGAAGSSFPGHYQSPPDRDGDYSYAYDCSVSPAFLIKWNGAVDDMYRDEEDNDEDEAKTENIYEEIDKRVDHENGENDDDDFHEKGMSDGNSSRKSSSLNSDSGIGASGGSRHRVVAKLGTLDVTQRGQYKKKEVTIQEGIEQPQKSSLDILLSKTTHGMSQNERMNLRKSLVDELFEELIQRHHSRVLEQLRLDVEEFIAPEPNPTPNKSSEAEADKSSSHSPFQRSKSTTASKLLILRRDKSGKSTVASRRSVSSTSPRRLRKCESIDFKEILSSSEAESPALSSRRANVVDDADQMTSSKTKRSFPLLSSAKKYSEAFQRKYLSRSTAAAKSKQQQQQQQQQQQSQQQSQVSRRGRRPLSAFLTRTSISEVIGSEPDEIEDSDSEEESARRLQRSKIIESFLKEQESNNNNNNNNHHGAAVSKKH